MPPALRPEITRLVEAGVLARAARDDGGDPGDGFGALAREATRRGYLTAGQAEALGALLGLGVAAYPHRPANDA